MRLHRLTVEGFMPYRKRQEVTFTGHSIFALVGPTGSGKSALLDAICFALYGKAPRWDNAKAASEIVAQGCKEARIEVEFSLSDQLYQVVRTVKLRKSGPNHEVEIRPFRDGEWEASSERTPQGAATQQITALLGMKYQVFTRALLLPQGQFDRLLKPEKLANRKLLLMELANLGIYDQMSELARARQKQAEAEQDKLTLALGQHEHISPEALAELELRIQALEAEQKALKRRLGELDLAAQLARRLGETTRTLEKALEQAQLLEQRADEMEASRRQLARARELEGERAQLDEVTRCRRNHRDKQVQYQQAKDALTKAEEGLAKAAEGLDQAETAAGAIPALESRLEALGGLAQVAREWARHTGELVKTRGELEQRRTAMIRLNETLTAEQTTLGKLEARLKLLEEERQSLAGEAGLEATLTGCRVKARAADELAGRLAELDLEAAHKAVAKAQQDLKVAEERFATADRVLKESERACREARRVREEHLAHRLRHNLKVGEPCPVCLQQVAQAPAEPDGEVLEVDELLAEAEQALEDARETLDARRLRLERADFEAEQAEEELEQVKAKRQELSMQLVAARQDLIEAMGWPGWPDDAVGTIESALAAEHQRRGRLDELALLKSQESEALRGLERAIAQLEADRRTGQQRLSELEAAALECEAQAAELDRQLSAEFGEGVDYLQACEQEVATVTTRARVLEKDRTQALDAKRTAEACKASAEALERERIRSRADAAAELMAVETRFLERLEELGLASEKDLFLALMAPDQMKRLEGDLQVYEDARRLTCQRIAECEETLAGRRVNQAEVEAAEAELKQCSEDLGECQTKLGGATREHGLMKEGLAKAQDLRDLLEQHSSQASTYKVLSGLLNADGLKAFVANRLLEEILERASVELERLSGRYRLCLRGDDIWVEDGWNAGEARDVRSLSGGETFLASLSLALAMVDYLSEGRPLESLFIDEGFGTLDQDTLEVVAQTLEMLQQRGRLVGVITHVSELAERLPVQIRVVKDQAGSRVLG
ncbi:MAG: AAA family ATPase [Vulcanimicrobiota bacterium]